MHERPTLVELVIEVNDRMTAGGVGHGFGGALALAYYVDEPRATRDMDINVAVPVTEAARVFELLPASIRWDDHDVRRCIDDGQVRLWSGSAPDGIPVDLFFPQHEFHDAVASRVATYPFARPDYFLPVIAAAHLTVLKAMFDRPKDWIDIASMLQARTVDIDEALFWLEAVLGDDHPSVARLRSLVADAIAGRLDAPGAEMATRRVRWQEER